MLFLDLKCKRLKYMLETINYNLSNNQMLYQVMKGYAKNITL